MLGPCLSQKQNNVSQLVVILSGLIVCANSALIISTKVNMTQSEEQQSHHEQPQQHKQYQQQRPWQLQQQQQDQHREKANTIGPYYRQSDDRTIQLKPPNLSDDYSIELEEVDDGQDFQSQNEGDKENNDISDISGSDSNQRVGKALVGSTSSDEISIRMSLFSYIADSKLDELLNANGSNKYLRVSAAAENGRESAAQAGSLRGSTSTSSDEWPAGRRLKRGLRARPKFSRKIFKKITPTKVLVGAHLGSWGYKQYKNWTAQANGTSVTPTISVNAGPGNATSLSPSSPTIALAPAILTPDIRLTETRSLTNGSSSSTSEPSEMVNVTTEAPKYNGSFVSEVAELFLGLRTIGTPGADAAAAAPVGRPCRDRSPIECAT